MEETAHAISPQCSRFQVSIQGQVFSYSFGRVTTVLGPLHGDARSSHSISVEDEVVTPKVNVWASTPISCPQSYELAISSMKRGVVEFNHGQPYPASITSVINTSAARVLTFDSLIPGTSTSHFYPWSNRDALENVWRTAQSFLFT